MISVEACQVSSGATTLLRPVTFSMGSGEKLVVRGANGAGKSTLLACLAGTLSPSSGRVQVGGIEAAAGRREFRQLVAASLATPPFSPDLTVRDWLEMVALSWHSSKAAARQSVDVTCTDLGMDALLRQFPGELSAGQTQLCSLATTLVRPSRVLVLDEPEHRLDADRVGMLGTVLNRRAEDGCAIVVATHSDTLTETLDGPVMELTGGGRVI